MTKGFSPPFLFAVLLIALRVAIGWHFFYEGQEKVASFGNATTTQPEWSSTGYLRESSGPLAPYFRDAAGDPHKEALERLLATSPTEHEGRKPYKEYLPSALARDWDDYVKRFNEHYKLEDAQRDKTQAALDQAKELAARWLLAVDAGNKDVEGKRDDDPKPIYEVDREFDNATIKVKRTSRQRIEEYRDLLEKIQRIEKDEQTSFEEPVRKDLAALKAEARQLRTTLLGDVNKFLTNRLNTIPNDTQKREGRLSLTVTPSRVWWADRLVAFGLVGIGFCLMIGFFSRTSAFLGALFLLSVYLAMPPWPGVPEPLKVEGHYLFVNKNLIEMLALLALATVPTGRWFGVDALVHAIFGRKRAAAVNSPTTPQTARP